jgi:hypothetical protein
MVPKVTGIGGWSLPQQMRECSRDCFPIFCVGVGKEAIQIGPSLLVHFFG